MPGRIGVVWNLAAGVPHGHITASSVSALFDGAPCHLELLSAATRHDLTSAGARCLQEGCDVLVAAGGDGTVGTLASLLAGSPSTLGILPTGTLNHFARDLGIPFPLAAAARIVLAGHIRAVDIGQVNGYFFVNNSSLGLYPGIVRRREHWEKTGASRLLAFAAALFFSLRRYPFLNVTVHTPASTFSLRSPFVFVGNNEYDIESFSIGRRPSLESGLLALYTAHRTGRFGLLRLAFSALARRLRRNRDFRILSSTELVIDARRKHLSVALDGEVVPMHPPLRYTMHPRALRVLTPA